TAAGGGHRVLEARDASAPVEGEPQGRCGEEDRDQEGRAPERQPDRETRDGRDDERPDRPERERRGGAEQAEAFAQLPARAGEVALQGGELRPQHVDERLGEARHPQPPTRPVRAMNEEALPTSSWRPTATFCSPGRIRRVSV